MASKKILLGIGLLAAVAIVFYAVIGWPPVSKNDTQGTIGIAKKYQAEQISEQDVVLADAEIQSFLQTDFFYQLVTDPDFRKTYLSGVLQKTVSEMPATLASANVASLTDLGKALSNDDVKQNIAAGKFDAAATLANSKGIKVTAEDLAKIRISGLGAQQVAKLGDLGRALSNDDVKQNIAAGKFDAAATLANSKGIKVTAEDLAKIRISGLGAHDVKGLNAHDVNGLSAHDVKSLNGHQVAKLNDLGRALVQSDVTQQIAAGKFDAAATLANSKGIKVTAQDLQRFDMQALGAKGVEDMAALGRLLQTPAFQKSLPYAGGLQKLMLESGTFKSAVKSGDLGKFSQDIAAAKTKAK
jgi:phosphotransferase system HPr-like phosphotransfer protein